MQREYREWHDAQYGDNSSMSTLDRLMNMYGFGDWSPGGGGGYEGSYQQLKDHMDTYGNESWRDNTVGEGSIFSYIGSVFKKLFGYYRNEGTRENPLFGSKDAAAVYWTMHARPDLDPYEYSALIVSIIKNGKKYYTYTDPVRLLINSEAELGSPGTENKLHKLKEGMIIEGLIHLHRNMQADNFDNNPGNENFSNKDNKAHSGDKVDWYLVSPTGVLRVWRTWGAKPAILGEYINGKFDPNGRLSSYEGKRPDETWEQYFKPRQ